MNYMLMIYAEEGSGPAPGTDEFGAYMGGYQAVTEEMKSSGKFVAGDPLEPVTTSTTVRVRDGKSATTDGPFAETKEQLGGFYILDCENLDEAIAYAERIPTAAHGSIEIRPIMTFD